MRIADWFRSKSAADFLPRADKQRYYTSVHGAEGDGPSSAYAASDSDEETNSVSAPRTSSYRRRRHRRSTMTRRRASHRQFAPSAGDPSPAAAAPAAPAAPAGPASRHTLPSRATHGPSVSERRASEGDENSAASPCRKPDKAKKQLRPAGTFEDEALFSDVNAPPKKRQLLYFVFKPEHERVGMHLARLPLLPPGTTGWTPWNRKGKPEKNILHQQQQQRRNQSPQEPQEPQDPPAMSPRMRTTSFISLNTSGAAQGQQGWHGSAQSGSPVTQFASKVKRASLSLLKLAVQKSASVGSGATGTYSQLQHEPWGVGSDASNPAYTPPSPLNTSQMTTMLTPTGPGSGTGPEGASATNAPAESRFAPESFYAQTLEPASQSAQSDGGDLDSESEGRWFVSCVNKGSPAAMAGIRFGDEIVAIEGIDSRLFSTDSLKQIFVNKVKDSRQRGEPTCVVEVEVIANAIGRDVFIAHDHASGKGYGFTFEGGRILKVTKGSNAERAGLAKGDRIVMVNGHCVVGMDDQSVFRIITAPTVKTADYLPPYSVKDMHLQTTKSHAAIQLARGRAAGGLSSSSTSSMQSARGVGGALPGALPGALDRQSFYNVPLEYDDQGQLRPAQGYIKPTLCLSVVSENLYRKITAHVTEAMLKCNVDHSPAVLPSLASRVQASYDAAEAVGGARAQ